MSIKYIYTYKWIQSYRTIAKKITSILLLSNNTTLLSHSYVLLRSEGYFPWAHRKKKVAPYVGAKTLNTPECCSKMSFCQVIYTVVGPKWKISLISNFLFQWLNFWPTLSFHRVLCDLFLYSCCYHSVRSLRAFTICQNWLTEMNWIVHKWNDVLILPNWESCLWSNCAFFHSRVSLIWGRCQCYQTDAHFICRLACLAGQVLSNVNHP